MEQVFRIEIPVEVTSNADLGKLKQIEAVLMKADQEARKLASSASSAFSQIASGASNAASSMQQMDSAASKSSDAMEEVSESADKIEDSAGDAADSVEDIGDAARTAGNAAESAFSGAEQSADKFSQRMEKSEKSLRQMFAEKFKMTLEAIDKVSPVVQEVTQKVKNFVSKAWKVTVKMADFVTAPFKALKNLIMSPITMTLSIAGIGLGASSFYNTFTDFTSGMSNVKALSGATEEEFKQLTATASELGATTKFTAAEASQGMQYLAMAGWETSDIIAGMPGLLKLAAAGSTDLGTAADIVSDVMTAMGMSANEATRAADVFAKTATSTNTTISMMGETLKYAAPAAKAFGMQLEDVSVITGMMANAGVKGSSAGTALRTALLRMASPTSEAAKAMKKLNLSFDDGKGNMKDMRTIMKDMGDAFAKLGDQEKLAYADDLFGKNASTAWLAVLDQGIDAFDDLSEKIYNSKGAAEEMQNIQLDNLAGDVTLLQSAVDGMKISLMDKLNPYLREGVQWLTSKIPEITTALGNLVDTGINKIKELKDRITDVFKSDDFQNADSLADKLFVAWDKVIAEPFSAWWNDSGKAFVLDIVGKIGGTFGEVVHGVIAGVFAAIKGEEIDFEGMNLTGIARAGAEAAREYVSSFAQGLNAPDLIGSMPGLMKAGVLGFGALKIGSGALGIAKTVGTLRLAFGGVTTAATTAAAATEVAGGAAAAAGTSAAGSASAFGGLGAALAAVPGWGWAALAALAAVGIGYKLYKDKQEQERQELLHLGDAVEEASDRYVKAAKKANDYDATIKGIQEIQLRLTEDKAQNAEVIAQVKKEITGIEAKEITLTATLVREGFDTEEAQTILDQVHAASSEVAELTAKLESGDYDEEEAKIIEDQIAEAKSKISTLTTALINLGYDEDTVNTIIDQIQEIETEKTATLTVGLQNKGYSVMQVAAIKAQYDNITDDQKEIALIFTAHTDMTPEEVGTMAANLTSLMAVKAEKEVKLSGYALTSAQISSLKTRLDKITAEKQKIEIEASETGATPELVAKYQALTDEEQIINLQLQGSEMSEDQYNAMTKQVDDLKSKCEEVVLNIANGENSDMTQEDVDHIFELLGSAGDYTVRLGFNLATGSLTKEDIEELNQQLETYAKHLEEISGGMISADEVMSGNVSEETQQRIDMYGEMNQLEQDAAYNRLLAENERARRARENGEGSIAERKKAAERVEASQTRVDDLSSVVDDLRLLQSVGDSLRDESEYMMEKFTDNNGNIDGTAYNQWYEGRMAELGQTEYNGRTYSEIYDSLAGRFSALGMDELIFNGMNWAGLMNHDDLANIAGGKGDVLFDALAAEQENLAGAKGQYNEANDQLIKQYQGEVDAKTYEASRGTEYSAMNIEELAANYASLDEVGRQVFDNAYKGLQQINEEAGYISEAEKTQTSQIMQTAFDSVQASAKLDLIDEAKTAIQGLADTYGNDLFAGSEEQANAITQVNEALKSLGSDVQIDSFDQIKTALDSLGEVDLESINFDNAAASVESMGGNATSAKEKVDEARAAMEQLDAATASSVTGQISSVGGAASSAASHVSDIKNAVRDLDGQTATVTINIRKNGNTNVEMTHATGGIFNTAHVGLVAEDGPEAIIPLGAKRRDRGLDLWMQAGRMMGVDAYAEGGILGPYSNALASIPDDAWDDDGGGSGDYKPGLSGGGGNMVNINVEVSPEYKIEGGDGNPEAVLEVIRAKQGELAELLGAAMADQLEDIISNM